jgi:hypothetical protein
VSISGILIFLFYFFQIHSLFCLFLVHNYPERMADPIVFLTDWLVYHWHSDKQQ